MAVLAIDFRGHGESTGSVDGPLHHDIVAGADLLRSHPLVDGMRLAYRGSSMGGYYGVLAAADAGLSALTLLCPASDEILLAALDRSVSVPFANGGPREDRTPPDESSSDLLGNRPPGLSTDLRLDEAALRAFLRAHRVLAAAEDLTCPALLFHARGDDVVPLADTLQLAAHLAGQAEVVITPGGDHRSLQASAIVHERVSAWLAATLRVPGRSPGEQASADRTV